MLKFYRSSVKLPNRNNIQNNLSEECLTHLEDGFIYFIKMREEVLGNKYQMLTILKDGDGLLEAGRKIRSVVCQCDCGNIKELKLRYLKDGSTKSCGCYSKRLKNNINPGDTFGFWTVLGEGGGYISNNEKSRTILVRCVCGKEKDVILNSLVSGKSKSCSCQGIPPKEKIKKVIPQDTEQEQWKESVSYPGYYISTLGKLFNYKQQYMFSIKPSYEVTVNGKIKEFLTIKEMYKSFIGDYDLKTHKVILNSTKIKLENIELKSKEELKVASEFKRSLYSRFYMMISRCYKESDENYSYYGGRGIKICNEWINSRDVFIQWCIDNGMTSENRKYMEIDRIDNNGNYEPSNHQLLSKRDNVLKQLGLTEEDVKYIRSNNFDWNKDRLKYKCSDLTIKNIIEGNTFKDL